jgi:hypothetical protein
MGGGGGTNTVSQTSLPPDVAARYSRNYDLAEAAADRPYQGYGGQTVAGLDPLSQQAAARAQALQGTGAAQIGLANAYTQSAGDYNPSMINAPGGPSNVTAGNISDNFAKYYDGNVENVINSSLNTFDQQRKLALNQTADQAVAGNALGGSRHALMEAKVNSNAAQQSAEMAANLRQQAYTQALSASESDRNAGLTAAQSNQSAGLQYQNQLIAQQQANQSAGLQAAALRMQAGSQLGSLAGQQSAITSQELGLLDAAGQQQRAIAQAQLDANKAAWTDQWNYPNQQVLLRTTAAGLLPNGSTTTTSTSGGPGNTAGMIVGGLTAAGGIASAIASDPDLKEDVEKVGEEGGIGVYTWRYKDDKPGTPRSLGVMADEVAKAYPEAAITAGGVQGVNPAALPPRLGALAQGMRPDEVRTVSRRLGQPAQKRGAR